MATPHVSGVAALLLSYKPGATPEELYNAMTSTAENPNTSGRDDRYGHGIVNALDALEALSGSGNNDGPPNNGGGTSCSQTEIDFQLDLRTDDYGYETSWELIDARTGASVDSIGEGVYGNNKAISVSKCLDVNDYYTLKIFDSYGDGICCGQNNPGFTVRTNGQVVASNQQFQSLLEIPGIGNCSNTPTPPGDQPTQPTQPNPTNAPVPPPTPSPVPPPTQPPAEDEQCCFLIWCWSC